MDFTVTVITCTHNPRREYLTRTLEALRGQTLAAARWELLLIDNASDEPLEGRFDVAWHPHAHWVREDKIGLTPARLRGIAEAKGELLVFVDDDNLLEPDYLEQALKISETCPHLGSWSGQNLPEFETPPPDWTKRYWGNLAIRFLEGDQWSNLPHLPETMPCGAGLCLRPAAAKHYVHLNESGKRNITLDRAGNSLMSAGDNDMAACACDIGLGVGVFAGLKLTHLMPPGRLEESYLLRLAEGIHYSGVIFHSFRSPAPPLGRSRWVAGAVDAARLLLMKPRERRFYRAVRRGENRARHFLQQLPAKPGGS